MERIKEYEEVCAEEKMLQKETKNYLRQLSNAKEMRDVYSIQDMVRTARRNQESDFHNFKDKPVVKAYQDELMRQSYAIMEYATRKIYKAGPSVKGNLVKGTAKALQR